MLMIRPWAVLKLIMLNSDQSEWEEAFMTYEILLRIKRCDYFILRCYSSGSFIRVSSSSPPIIYWPADVQDQKSKEVRIQGISLYTSSWNDIFNQFYKINSLIFIFSIPFFSYHLLLLHLLKREESRVAQFKIQLQWLVVILEDPLYRHLTEPIGDEIVLHVFK